MCPSLTLSCICLWISDFEMLSPEPRGAFFVIFLLPILHVQGRKIAVLASRRLRELFFDLLREAPLHELYIKEHVKKIISPGHPDVSQGTCGTRSLQPAPDKLPKSSPTHWCSRLLHWHHFVFPCSALLSLHRPTPKPHCGGSQRGCSSPHSAAPQFSV